MRPLRASKLQFAKASRRIWDIFGSNQSILEWHLQATTEDERRSQSLSDVTSCFHTWHVESWQKSNLFNTVSTELQTNV